MAPTTRNPASESTALSRSSQLVIAGGVRNE
jgi:hypothetical protein